MKFNQPSNSGGLALDKLAGRGNNAEGAKKRVEKLRNHELNKKHKLKKLKKRLDGTSQQHAKQAPRDNVSWSLSCCLCLTPGLTPPHCLYLR
jgi:hypothetical protein